MFRTMREDFVLKFRNFLIMKFWRIYFNFTIGREIRKPNWLLFRKENIIQYDICIYKKNIETIHDCTKS